MNKFRFTLICLFFASVMQAQQNDIVVIIRPVTQGYDYVKSADIQATEYMFPERIDAFEIDEMDGVAAVQLRGVSKNGKSLNKSGDFVLYDLKTQMPRWSKKINFPEENATLTGGRPFLLKPYSVTALDEATGAEKWTGKTQIFYADKKTGTGVGYKFNSLNPASDNLEGIDLNNGNTIWKRNLDRTYGWNDITKINDSLILITSGGLYAINLKNGLGWDYKAHTGKKQTGEAVAKGLGSVMLGVLTGVTVIPNVDVITGIVSNTLSDSTGIYLASAGQIGRLNSNGTEIWTTQLPKDLCSASAVYRKNGNIYLINKGIAYENGNMREYGRPFVAVFNEMDGAQVYFRSFDEKKLILNDFEVQGDTINLLFHNKIVQLSLKTDTVLSEKSFDLKNSGYLYSFANDKTFFQQDDTFVPARQNRSKYLITTSTGNVLILNDKMETEQKLTTGEFHKKLFESATCKLLYKEGSLAVVSHDGKRLAEIKTSPKVLLKGSKLYEAVDKVLREIELDDIIP